MAGELRIAKFKHLNPKNGDVFPTAGDVVEPDTLFVYPIGTGIMKTGMSDGSGVFLGSVRQEELFLHDQKDENGNYIYTAKSPQWYLDRFGEGVIVRELVPLSSFSTENVGGGASQGHSLDIVFAGDEFVLMTTTIVRNYQNEDDLYAVLQTLEGNIIRKLNRNCFGWDQENWEPWVDVTPVLEIKTTTIKSILLSSGLTFTEAEKDTLAAKFGFQRG